MRKSRKDFEDEDEGHMDDSWLIPYADILTLLLALFIVLYASSNIDKVKYHSIMESFKSELTGTKIDSQKEGLSAILPSKQQPTTQTPTVVKSKEEIELEQLKKKVEKYIGDNHLDAVVSLQDTKRGVEISFKEVILFDPGKADLKESSFKTLDAILGLINTVQNQISIEGHTDNVPIGNAAYASNWELSAARAASVLHYFESKNVAENRLQFTGHGEFQPLNPNDTPEHRRANRRVNVVILRSI